MTSWSATIIQFLYRHKQTYYGFLFALILSPIFVAILNSATFSLLFYFLIYFPLLFIITSILFFIFGYTEGRPNLFLFAGNYKGTKMMFSIFPFIGPILCSIFTAEEFKKIEKNNPDFKLKKELAWVDGKKKKFKYQTVDYSKNKQEMWDQTDFNPEIDEDYPVVRQAMLQIVVFISLQIF